MQVIEIIGTNDDLTLRQRWSTVFTILVSVALLLFGLNLRNRILVATSVFESTQAGIRAEYPQNWLIDTQGDYVFRVRDMARSGFKTTIQVSVLPIGPDAEERNVAERLALSRLSVLTAYEQLAVDPYILPDGSSAQAVSHTFVNRNTSPFLQGVPSVVRGLDILALRGGQAIVITFRADAAIYEQEFQRFDVFLRRLEF